MTPIMFGGLGVSLRPCTARMVDCMRLAKNPILVLELQIKSERHTKLIRFLRFLRLLLRLGLGLLLLLGLRLLLLRLGLGLLFLLGLRLGREGASGRGEGFSAGWEETGGGHRGHCGEGA